MTPNNIFEEFEDIENGPYGWTTDDYVDCILVGLTDEECWDLKILLADNEMLYSEDGVDPDGDESTPNEKYLITVSDLLEKKYLTLSR